jgi:hypothetical protein
VYTESDLVFEPALVGVWQQQDSPATWAFTQRGDKTYELVFTDNGGRSGRFEAHLARVGGATFLDLFPDTTDVTGNDFHQFHLVPIHTVYVVEATEPNLTLAGIDYNWLEQYLAENPGAIPFVTFNGRKMITASTEELQNFLVEHREQFTARIHFEKGAR